MDDAPEHDEYQHAVNTAIGQPSADCEIKSLVHLASFEQPSRSMLVTCRPALALPTDLLSDQKAALTILIGYLKPTTRMSSRSDRDEMLTILSMVAGVQADVFLCVC
ncbi:hypothetical protein N7G274_000199 [Stereocaulon virgatum]|uniref:Uncharacterized protein n=1 Tax=Stereocaulon virgatum TaxID=373712 RepID=A0ABR4AT37_9LECA